MSRRGAFAMLTGSSAVQAVSGGGAAILATALLGPAARGAMVLGLSVSAIAVLVAGLGTGAALRSRVTSTRGQGRLLAAYSWWSVAAVGLGAVGAAVACLVCAPFIDAELGRPGFLVAVAVVTAGQTAIAQQSDAWFAAGLFTTGGTYAAASAGAGLGGVVVGAMLYRDATVLLLGQGLGVVLVAAVALWRLREAGLAFFGRPRLADIGWLLGRGLPVLGATAGFVVAMRADRFVLGVFAGTAAVGVYSLAATLSEVPRMLPAAAGQLLLRDVAVARRGAPVRRALGIATGLTVAAGVVIGVVGWLLVVPLFGAEFAGARPALLVLLAAEVALVPYGLAIRALVGGGWTAAAGGLGLTGALCGLVLFSLTVPLWTVMGAAVASALLYLGVSIGAWRMLERRLAAVPADQPDGVPPPPVAPAPAIGVTR